MKEKNMSKTNQQANSMSSKISTEVIELIPTGRWWSKVRRTIIKDGQIIKEEEREE